VDVLNGGVRLHNDVLHALQQALDALAVLGQGLAQRRKALLLPLAESLELGKCQSLEQLAITLDLAAEEVAHRDHQQWWTVLGAQSEQLSERWIAGLAYLLRQDVERLPLGLEELLRVAEARQVARILSERRGVEAALAE